MENTILIICGIITIYWLAITLKCVFVQKRIHWLSPSSVPIHDGSTITAIIPARNEEQDIAASLRSVLNQEGIKLEVIVVNDHSTDR